ncbi:MAG: CBS domain-containing protein [Candidatus Micrarchaeota archaeon]|nr:CBS domain-containing protein [Candidatus Micrarchaeota archaeon]
MNIKPALVLDSEEPLSRALNEILKNGTCAVITKDAKYCGIVEDRDLSYGITDASKMKCGTACVNAPVLHTDSTVLERLNAFMAGHFKGLAVKDEHDSIVGITSRVELMNDLFLTGIVPHTPVSEMMNSPVYTINYEDTIGAAKGKMKECNTHRLVVMKNGYPQGVVSSYDLAAMVTRPKGKKDDAKTTEMASPDNRGVLEILRDYVNTIEKNETVAKAVEKMIDKSNSSIIVTENKKPVGVFSASDLFKYVLDQFKQTSNILVSGLGEDDVVHLKEIRESLELVFKKFEKSIEIESMNIHVKEGKSVYSVRAFIQLDGGHISLATEGYTLMEAIDKLAKELYVLLHKKKEILTTKKDKHKIRD